ncbi:cupin domain-containing protein [Pleionea sp. CnH1-48]|uniref:cupin domain-containing protein n=1 Tax=Pleionea sp. CnH1-48 TaxID=2954494 RepID=UPI002097C05B|nr:cupin domain-containing protein [Pleionea sp. CnH1-48]MCO7222805.1 cupin domain-containing protein [Pleionea sp. CnH1-48]
MTHSSWQENKNMSISHKMTSGKKVKERLLSSITEPATYFAYLHRLASLFELSEEKMQQVLNSIESISQSLAPVGDWRKLGSHPIFYRHFQGGDASKECGLVYLKCGCEFPHHHHIGREVSILIQGELEEDSGTRYQAGDLIVKLPGSQHAFRCCGEQDAILCVLLDESVRF